MSEDRKQDLIDNEHERVQRAVRDLALFVRNHGCMPCFNPDGTVQFIFNADEEQCEKLAERVEEKWTYTMISEVNQEGGQNETFAEGAAEAVSRQFYLQKRLDAVAEKLGPDAMVQMIQGMQGGNSPEEMVENLEALAAEVERNEEMDEKDPTRMLSSFDVNSIMRKREPKDEDEALDDMFGDDDDY